MPDRVRVLIINHDTSDLAEVALLSLVASTLGWDGGELLVTLSDNTSTDPAAPRLRRTAAELGVEWVTSRWPHPGRVATDRLDSTGDCLRDFILAHDDCDYYWLVDSDIDLPGPGVLDGLLAVARDRDDLWAVTATLLPMDDIPLRQVEVGTDIEMVLERSVGGRNGRSRKTFTGPLQGRSSHACTLVRRTPFLRSAVELLGLSQTVVLSADPAVGGFYDTFGIATKVMQAAGYAHTTAPVEVLHAAGGSWADHARAERAVRAERRRAELLAVLDRGAGPDRFAS
jgi:hypothetical protein